MPEGFMRGIEVVNGIVWGPMGLGLLFGTGLLLTVRTGGFQLRRWGYWMRHTLGAILTDQSVTAHTAREEQAISQFQSLCTAPVTASGTPKAAFRLPAMELSWLRLPMPKLASAQNAANSTASTRPGLPPRPSRR